MALFSYSATAATKTKPSLSGFTSERDTFDTSYDHDWDGPTRLIADGLNGNLKITIGGVKLTHETASGGCDDPSITALGTVDGTRLFLVSYIDKGSIFYAVYDIGGNAIKTFTKLHGADGLTGVHFNADGDVVLQYRSNGDTYYSSITSGYNSAPVAKTDATATGDADQALTVEISALGSDPTSDPLSLGGLVVGTIVTSDSSAGSAIAVKDSDGNLLVLYTGVLAEGATAEVPVSFSVSDGDKSDTDGLVTVSFEGTGSETVALTLAQARALIAAGYDTFAEFGGAITGFVLVAKSTVLADLSGEDIDAMSQMGVTTMDATDDKLSVSFAMAQDLFDGGIAFDSADTVTVAVAAATVKSMDSADLDLFADGNVDILDLTENAISLTVEQALVFAEDGLKFAKDDVVTIADSTDTVFVLSSDVLASLAAIGSSRIDLTDDEAIADLSTIQMFGDQGFKFAASDEVIVTTGVDVIKGYSKVELKALADMGVDAIDFWGTNTLVSASFVKKIKAAGLDLYDPTDLAYPTNGDDTLTGGYSNDVIDGLGGNDKIYGDYGNDTLIGGKGNDTIDGGGYADWIDGGLGNDRLTGGTAGDTFVFKPGCGRDIILDFVGKGDDHDIVDLTALNAFKSYSDLKDHMKSRNGDIVITIDSKNQITLDDTTMSELAKADFLW